MSKSFVTEHEASSPVIEELVANSETLILIFGGIKGAMGMPTFEFYNSTSILNHHRVFFRDLSQRWYHSGLAGISQDIPQTCAYIRGLIERIHPKRTIFVGNSMGGYAAILFSTLLNTGRVVAFAPQTFISPAKKLLARDFRWKLETLGTYISALSKPQYFDLAQVLEDAEHEKGLANQIELHVSSFDRLDMLHANHLRHFQNVDIHPHALGGHNLVRHLRDNGNLRTILTNACAGKPASYPPDL